jgi:two-component system C4-dicarboxylate transport sensor histidine kinase DctB
LTAKTLVRTLQPAKKLLSFIGAVAAIGLSAFVSQHVWRESGLKSLQAINEQRVQLVANAVDAEVGRQDHLPVVLSLDRDVRNALATPRDAGLLAELNSKLTVISHEADTRALYIIGPDGTVLASDDWQSPDTLVGRNLSTRPYFTEAIASGKSTYLGLEPESNRVRYYLAEAVREGSLILGIAVVRIEFDPLEAAWERAAERVFVTDRDGIAFLASDPTYKYRSIGPAPTPEQAADLAKRYPGVAVSPIRSTVIERRNSASIVRVDAPDNGVTYLYQSLVVPNYGWTIHRLTDLTSVREDQRDGGIIGAAVSALLIALVLYLLQRHRAYAAARDAGARLTWEVAQRTRELSQTNTSLQNEIDEHRRTETRLRATQNELVQAGKLAALGEMSAALAHEINQPLGAIRTFMASAKVFAQRGNLGQVVNNLDHITDLAERMASITGHLKTFARRDR